MTAGFAIPFPVQSLTPLSADEYLSFLADRPETERWQLIDGIALMMAPATRVHQVIVVNLLRLFNDALDVHRPDLMALSEVGLITPGRPDFRPQADIAFVRTDAPLGPWQEQFYLAAEILSESNTGEYIAEKRERYTAQPDNQYVLIVEQRRVHVEVFARREAWQPRVLRDLDDILDLPEFGIRCSLARVYRRTPLA